MAGTGDGKNIIATEIMKFGGGEAGTSRGGVGGRHSLQASEGVGVDRARISVPNNLNHWEQVGESDRGEPLKFVCRTPFKLCSSELCLR